MKEFIALRSKARENRDRVINLARREYERSLAKIAAREKDSLTKVRKGAFQASLDQVIPRNREFTVTDLLSALKSLDAKRRWLRQSVDRHICRLRKRGIVRRLKKSSNQVPAVYVWNGAPVNERPFGDKPLSAVAAEVLGKRPMTRLELTVAILEAGYETAMSKRAFHIALGTVLRQDGRFKRDGEKWSSATYR